MPIRINLLAEAQAAEELRRKDPVKRAFWIAGFLVFLVLLWSVTLQLKIQIARLELSSLDNKWQTLKPVYDQVEAQSKQVGELNSKLHALTQFTTNRVLWGSALNALQSGVVDQVQLVRIKTEQTYTLQEAVKARTNDTVVVPGKPATAVERVLVLVDAKDYSPRPADQVARYKETLTSLPFFQNQLERTNGVRLTSLSAPQGDPASQNTFVTFALQLSFQEKERRGYE